MIDIGANIGTYTMYSSSIGRTTISVECYQPNIDRIVRAIQIENVSKYVTLIGNAIYNESGKFLELSKDNSNVGGQGLITNQTIENSSSISNQFRGHLTKEIF
jgi:FkbM family methyltransferase